MLSLSEENQQIWERWWWENSNYHVKGETDELKAKAKAEAAQISGAYGRARERWTHVLSELEQLPLQHFAPPSEEKPMCDADIQDKAISLISRAIQASSDYDSSRSHDAPSNLSRTEGIGCTVYVNSATTDGS
ncbi:hypothetical protein QFC19_000115 [Naganishia cerealis]|uniref:Uncharacterized protein n=1 Tax=Naganishia cerealis TaxID=610337 RepID=A0ACC2WQ63_9TREE|nr:hypothetical protein QFC19_000115 [Naganishia cerealis]